MSHRYSTALSHIILAGTGIYCLNNVGLQEVNCPQITFGIITANSIIGVWRWGNPSYGDKVEKLYKLTSYLQFLFAVPCITTTIWLSNGYDRYLSWAWSIVPCVSLILYVLNSSDERINEVLIPFNLLATGVVSFLSENYYGIASAASYAINHYIVVKEGANYDIPAQDLYNYGLCFFAYFALRAIMH